MDVIEKMAKAAWLSVTGYDQWTDEEKAAATVDEFSPWDRWPKTGMSKNADDFRNAARAALIALRDGVTADQATIEATLSDSEYGYGSFLEPFQNALNHVLQEGEKDTESAK